MAALPPLPMVASGRRVRLNAAVKAAGHILVEAADHKGRALPGRTFDDAVPILGDSPHITGWRGVVGTAYNWRRGAPSCCACACVVPSSLRLR